MPADKLRGAVREKFLDLERQTGESDGKSQRSWPMKQRLCVRKISKQYQQESKDVGATWTWRSGRGTEWDKVLHLYSNKPSKVGISDEKESNGHTIDICNLWVTAQVQMVSAPKWPPNLGHLPSFFPLLPSADDGPGSEKKFATSSKIPKKGDGAVLVALTGHTTKGSPRRSDLCLGIWAFWETSVAPNIG